MASEPNPSLTPAITPPPGLRSQLINPPNNDLVFIVICVVVISFSTPVVAVRLYTRYKIKPTLDWDDATCLLGWIFMVTLGALAIRDLQWGGGSDLWNVSKARFAELRENFHTTVIVARVGMCCTKISILLLYLRLFVPKGTKWTPVWWSVWLCFWYNILYAIALVIAEATECAGKNPKGVAPQCIDEYALLICASAVNVSSNIMILIIPIAAIWGLPMPAHKKWKISAIFLVGGVAVVSSVVRLGYAIVASKRRNQSIAITTIAVLKLSEQFIGVVVSCMPILPVFYRHVRLPPDHPTSTSSAADAHNVGLAESVLGYQRKKKKKQTFSERSKRSTAKDAFPVSAANGELTTGGYEELDELEAQPQPQIHATKSGWGESATQNSQSTADRAFKCSIRLGTSSRNTEVDVISESRYYSY